MRVTIAIIALCTALTWGNAVFAQEAEGKLRMYQTCHVATLSPKIDGHLNDLVWGEVEWSGDFTQTQPNSGAEPSHQTAFKMIFDDAAVYFGIRAFDAEPEMIVDRISRRDEIDADRVEIHIDSYFDKRTAFSFALSPSGVRGDEIISNDGNNRDDSWNPVWYGAASIDEEGWIAEIRIPLSQLRFSGQNKQVWGLQVIRDIFHKDERSTWQYIPNNAPGWVSLFGSLHGIEGIGPSRRVEILPYAVGDVRRFQKESNNPFLDGQNMDSRLGVDAKIGVTGNLTLDMTINPDFGQVEADPSQVNLSAFEIFFQERRPFFVEGKNITEFRVGGGGPFWGGLWNDQLFYSRRIGRAPQWTPSLAAGATMEVPKNTSILGAFKLTGKTSRGLSIGVINAMTQKTNAEIDIAGRRSQQAVEPFTNYLVTRLQQDFNGGLSSIGIMATATNRNIRNPHLNFLNRAAYSGGLDFRHQWGDRFYSFDGSLSFSHIRGASAAITRIQRSSARFYQRPDADYVNLDSTLTDMSGHGGSVRIFRSGNSPWRIGLSGTWRSPGLELNDLGFLSVADKMNQSSWFGYESQNPGWIFRRYNLYLNQYQDWNFGGDHTSSGGNLNGFYQFNNYWGMWMDFSWNWRGLSTSALRGGPALRTDGGQGLFMGIDSDGRKNLILGLEGAYYWNRKDSGRFTNIGFSISYRPRNAMKINIRPFLSTDRNEMQYVSTKRFQGADRYILGQIDQKTVGITLRMDYSVTPNLSFQYYGQPFISAGRYSRLKRVTDPRADRFSGRFHTFTDSEIIHDTTGNLYHFDENGDSAADYTIGNPDFNFRQFRSNLVLRWEYIPGSTLFLVWAQERTGVGYRGDFSLRKDFGSLFNIYPTNFFLVKLNRWFAI